MDSDIAGRARTGGDMNDASSTLAFIRQARLKQLDLKRQYDELQEQIDAKIEVTPLRRPTRRGR